MIFDFKEIANRLNITGVIHVGGFVGEELSIYRECGLYNTIMFEPQLDLAEIIDSKMVEGEEICPIALGDEPGEATMFISETEGGIKNGSGAPSSLLKPFKHLTEHKNVTFPAKKRGVLVDTLDNWISDTLSIKDELSYNFLNIDVQGYELKVLKGAERTLDNIKGLIVEVNRDEVYKDCAKIWEIDEFLENKGFKRTLLTWQSESWGDALYERS